MYPTKYKNKKLDIVKELALELFPSAKELFDKAANSGEIAAIVRALKFAKYKDPQK